MKGNEEIRDLSSEYIDGNILFRLLSTFIIRKKTVIEREIPKSKDIPK